MLLIFDQILQKVHILFVVFIGFIAISEGWYIFIDEEVIFGCGTEDLAEGYILDA